MLGQHEPSNPAVCRLGVLSRLLIRWRHRRVANPRLWVIRVSFDELMAANRWDLARNFDELNDRYEQYSEIYRDGYMPKRRRSS